VGSATTDVVFELTPNLAPKSDVQMQEIMPIDVPTVKYTMAPAHHNNFSVFQPLSLVPGVLGLPSGIDIHYNSENARYHSGFDLPPLDLDLFNLMLENKQVPEPTAEEITVFEILTWKIDS
jgi:hypothetical protein